MIDEQAAYFGITRAQAIDLGRQAKIFTASALAQPFTIYTRWRSVFGSRYYAIVITQGGRDLNELLVTSGLARIYGTRTPLPDGRDFREYLAYLHALENQQRLRSAAGGVWCSREVFGNRRGASQQSRLELWLRFSFGLRRANNLDCRRASERRKALLRKRARRKKDARAPSDMKQFLIQQTVFALVFAALHIIADAG